MSDESIKKMASLLRSGATMLDKYCPKCGKILFKLENDKIFCPVCELEVVIEKKNSIGIHRKNSKIPMSSAERNTDSYTFIELNNIFSEKLSSLSDQIRSTEDIYQLEKLLDISAKLLNILKLIREIQR